MDKDEKQLNRNLELLIKKANQRILRLERLTGEKETFATKQLYDYAGIPTLNALTSKGRISSRNYTEIQQQVLEKALNQFISSASTATKIKKYIKQKESESGLKITLSQANTLYQSEINYSWIYAYIPQSEFWGSWVQKAKEKNWSQNEWIRLLSQRISDTVDDELKYKLMSLYDYAVKGE